VELLHANPHFVHVRFANGREDTVSTTDLSPPALPLPEFHDKVAQFSNEETISPTRPAANEERIADEETALEPKPDQLRRLLCESNSIDSFCKLSSLNIDCL